MAFIFADLSEQYMPLPGEGAIELTLDRQPTGYRMKAVTPEGRDVGRWVSDCPLTATLQAMLWLGQSSWAIRQARESLPLQKIIDEVPGLAPRAAHPQAAIDTLRLNFPPKPTESQVTGARIQFDEGQPVTLAHRHQQRMIAAEPEPVEPQVDHGGIDPVGLEQILRGTIRSLRASVDARAPAGAAYAEPMGRLMGALGVQQHPDYSQTTIKQAVQVINGIIAGVKQLKSGASALSVYEGVLAVMGMQKAADSLEEELQVIDQEIAEAEASVPEAGAALEPSYRPLQPGEIPKNLTPDQVMSLEAMTADDGRVRAKMQQTVDRAQREHERINRVLAARRAAEAAAAAAGEPAPQVQDDHEAASTDVASLTPLQISPEPPVDAKAKPARPAKAPKKPQDDDLKEAQA